MHPRLRFGERNTLTSIIRPAIIRVRQYCVNIATAEGAAYAVPQAPMGSHRNSAEPIDD
jgi:hypothetical protein